MPNWKKAFMAMLEGDDGESVEIPVQEPSGDNILEEIAKQDDAPPVDAPKPDSPMTEETTRMFSQAEMDAQVAAAVEKALTHRDPVMPDSQIPAATLTDKPYEDTYQKMLKVSPKELAKPGVLEQAIAWQDRYEGGGVPKLG